MFIFCLQAVCLPGTCSLTHRYCSRHLCSFRTWQLTNERAVWGFIDQWESSKRIHWPMREKYKVTLTNERAVWCFIDQWESIIRIHWPIRRKYKVTLTNEREVSDHIDQWESSIRSIAPSCSCSTYTDIRTNDLKCHENTWYEVAEMRDDE